MAATGPVMDPSVAPAVAGEHRGEPEVGHGVVGVEPVGVVVGHGRAVPGQLHVVEPVPGPLLALGGQAVLVEAVQQVEVGLEVGLAEQGRAVAGAPQHGPARAGRPRVRPR